ncbi:MAG: TRAP transporter substrate-binding protein DctP [Deltaproteobacteria bacterium]|nr:TRAP transporter substrate-binding protein DctP [Deltaproteobacteria bacterium]
MKKKLFLITFLIGFMAIVSIPAYAEKYNGPTIKWRFGLTGVPRIGTFAVDWFAKEVEKRSAGKMKIKVQYGSTLSTLKQARDSIKTGVMDGGLVRMTKTSETPLGSVIGLPCIGLSDKTKVKDVCDWMSKIYTHPMMVKEWEERWNNKYLFPVVYAPRAIGSFKKITVFEDFKGIRLRESKIKGEPFKNAGAVLTWIGVGDLYSALERKMIDAVAFPCPSSMVAYNLQEVLKYVLWHIDISYSSQAIACNKKKYDALPAPLRMIIDEVAAEIPEFAEKDTTPRMGEAWETLKSAGVKIIEATPEFRSELKKRSKIAHTKWISSKALKKSGVSEKQAIEALKMVQDITNEIQQRYN